MSEQEHLRHTARDLESKVGDCEWYGMPRLLAGARLRLARYLRLSAKMLVKERTESLNGPEIDASNDYHAV